MRLDRLQAFALSLPGATVGQQWGEILVFKVRGKMFLLIPLDGAVADGLTFKCRPDDFDALTALDGVGQAPYCAKRHWVRVADLTVVPEVELQRRIRTSYDLVVAGLPRRIRSELDPTAAGVRPAGAIPRGKKIP